MKILITGAAGYIGSILCPTLLDAGHSVTVLDSFRHDSQQALSLAACCANPNFNLVRGDARDSTALRPLLTWADAVIPLAALVGAPLCAQCPDEATSVNRDAVQYLVKALSCDQLVIYPNSNSGYGTMPEGNNAPLDEDAPQRPLSLYARTKCEAEDAVLQHPNSVCFRLATVFGASPRMRCDLLANDLALRAARDGFVMLYDPDARRNFVHVRDVAEAFLWAIEWKTGPIDPMREGSDRGLDYSILGGAPSPNVFNLGIDSANVTKRELCEIIKRHVPNFAWSVGEGHDPDARDYVISNDRLHRAGFEAKRALNDGVVELLKLYRGFSQTQYGNV